MIAELLIWLTTWLLTAPLDKIRHFAVDQVLPFKALSD